MPHCLCIITKTKKHIHLIRMIEIIHSGEKNYLAVTRSKTSYIVEATTTSLMNV
jgi:hypothetical protein